ncbi:hypothetical protein D6851_12370 [Altericroceibacterium spongiae]|uniref:DUF2238 domain-containing protein n=1 Tax=Altericroceibacterium spongiae TaxID=2320269 RepID=A0A420EF02_9SPHN|nr:hypothetical protein [Altericroceibacterium spongiae]RKF19253.1 hypothetical protein D6851_12370 [Altericroceibacterium spongiae]
MAEDTERPTPSLSGWTSTRLYKVVLAIVLVVMLGELGTLIHQQRWMHVFLVAAIIPIMASPVLGGSRIPVKLPTEIQIFSALFIFASIFLGEVQDFYNRIWWWDIALHTTSGVLLGLLGFIILYLLNENDVVDVRMRPSFVALFAFFFAVCMGAIWEIVEFTIDQLFGTTMQKPMLGDPSGLTDTMWDLIVDTLGAAVACLTGWRYMYRARRDGGDSWVKRFARKYPDYFGQVD